MDTTGVFEEIYGRVPPIVADAVDGLDTNALTTAPKPGANTIAWLAWHLTRVQDHHISELLDDRQLWETGEWAAHFGLDADPRNTGYGHTPAQVASVRPDNATALTGYLDAVHERSMAFLQTLTQADLDRVVDRRWDPPVTMGVRLVSIADDCLQHAGQAAYLKGILQR